VAAAGDSEDLAQVEEHVDDAAAYVWAITDREVGEIRRSLQELG
jgi:hypothetical protein